MILPFFASFIIFILILNRAILRNNKKQRTTESSFWDHERSVNMVRKKSLDGLNYISFSPDSIRPETLIPTADLPAFLEEEKLSDILERLTQLSAAKIVNLNYITNTDLKATYGVANLTTLMEYDQNYTDLITCLQEYASLLFNHGHPAATLTVLTLALDSGSDISASYLLAANSYRQLGEDQKIEDLIQKAQNLDSPRSSSIVRALRKSDPDNGWLRSSSAI